MDNVAENLKTPISDRGVEKPYPVSEKEIEVVIDWLQVTIQGVAVDDVLKRLFNIEVECCQHTPSGLYGYNNTYTYASKIHIMWHSLRSEMGVHFQISGTGCRMLEDLMSWKTFFDRLLSFDVINVTRIDIAIDSYKRYFDVPQLKDKVKSGELSSKFRKSTYMEQLNVADGAQESSSLTFGSMRSDVYIVFYDKLAERKNAGFDVSVDFWVRTELRFKHDLATKLLGLIVENNYHIGSFVFEVLYNYIDFKEKGTDSHKYRWKTCDWWIDFLGVVEKLQLAPKASQSTIDKKRKWADIQLCKVMAILRMVDNDFYVDLFKSGYKKISKIDLDIINAHFISLGKPTVSQEDLFTIYQDYMSVEAEIARRMDDVVTYNEQMKLDGIGTLL